MSIRSDKKKNLLTKFGGRVWIKKTKTDKRGESGPGHVQGKSKGEGYFGGTRVHCEGGEGKKKARGPGRANTNSHRTDYHSRGERDGQPKSNGKRPRNGGAKSPGGSHGHPVGGGDLGKRRSKGAWGKKCSNVLGTTHLTQNWVQENDHICVSHNKPRKKIETHGDANKSGLWGPEGGYRQSHQD